MPFPRKRLPKTNPDLPISDKPTPEGSTPPALNEKELKEVFRDSPLTPPIEAVILKLRNLKLDEIPLRKLKDFYNDMRQAIQEVGEYINNKDQEESFSKCSVCGNPIRNRPMGSLPGYDLKTGESRLLYTCSTTCFDKARHDMDQRSVERMNEREVNVWKTTSRYAPPEAPNG